MEQELYVIKNYLNYLVLIDGEDKTFEITGFRYERKKPLIRIRFKNGKTYAFNSQNVQFLKNPRNEKIAGNQVLCAGKPVANVKTAQWFDGHCRLVFNSGWSQLWPARSVRIVFAGVTREEADKRLEYLKELADRIGLTDEEGNNILLRRYEKIRGVRENSALGTFLMQKPIEPDPDGPGFVVYPFGFNLSQMAAIDNALSHGMSVIEGPPGTGKTQTILNILANAIMQGKSVAVASSNNSAIENVVEKLRKYGIDFIAALLGSVNNQNDFVKNQPPLPPEMPGWDFVGDEQDMARRLETLQDNLALKNELFALLAERDAIHKENLH